MNNKPRVALLALTALTTGCIEVQTGCDEVLLSMEELGDVQGIFLDIDAGGALVLGGETDEVHVMREWSFTDAAPVMQVEVVGEVLVVSARCDEAQLICSSHHELHMPAGLPLIAELGSGGFEVDGLSAGVSVELGSGGVTATDIAGGLTASLGSGGLEVMEISGPLLIDLGSGGVEGSGLRAAESVVSVGSGGVDLRFAEAPMSVDVSAGSGGVDLLVPAGAYALDLDVGSGGLEVSGIQDDPSAEASIVASAGSGGISVTGFTPTEEDPTEEN